MLGGLTRNKMYSSLYMNHEFVRGYLFLYKICENIVRILFSLLNIIILIIIFYRIHRKQVFL